MEGRRLSALDARQMLRPFDSGSVRLNRAQGERGVGVAGGTPALRRGRSWHARLAHVLSRAGRPRSASSPRRRTLCRSQPRFQSQVFAFNGGQGKPRSPTHPFAAGTCVGVVGGTPALRRGRSWHARLAHGLSRARRPCHNPDPRAGRPFHGDLRSAPVSGAFGSHGPRR